MNQRVSEKLPVDYLFVMHNFEPKQLNLFKLIDMNDFIRYLTFKRVYKNFTISSSSNKKHQKKLKKYIKQKDTII